MLIFIRHAVSESNVNYVDTFHTGNFVPYPNEDPDITPMGEQQAADAGRALRSWLDTHGKTIDRVIVSPMFRTMRTASIFLEAAGYKGKVILDPDVRETMKGWPSDKGTPKSKMYDRFTDGDYLLNTCDIDESLITKDVWYSETPETDQEINDRKQTIEDRYLKPALKEKSLTLIFSHSGTGKNLSGFKRIANCEMVIMDGQNAARSLYVPPMQYKSKNNPQPPRPPSPH